MIRFIYRHKRKITMVLAILLILALVIPLLLSGCGTAQESAKQNAEPVTISVWTYYNGDQLAAFNTMVEEFNSGPGQEAGIRVESFNVGGVSDLEETVMGAARGAAGAEPMPNIFAAYADTAYAIDKLGLLADLAPFFTEEEKAQYIPGYLEEGSFGKEGQIKIFPIAKSVEISLLNRTEWDPFAAATGAKLSELDTIEGLVRTAEKYYEWTDAKTPDIPNDGEAFYGRDSMSNYMFIGAKQLGTQIVTVSDDKVTLDFDRAAVRRLWDNYYIPFIKGYFGASGRFRSDDIKTGTIICLTGSSSGSTYFPREVVLDDMTTHEIEMTVLHAPKFEGAEAYAVQQGAGMAVANTSEEDVRASVTFLKWMTGKENNIGFSVSSGYLPVLENANSMEAIKDAGIEADERMLDVLDVSFDTVMNNSLYTPAAFRNGTAFRNVLETAMSDFATADRKTVVERLEAGMTLEEAVEQFTTDSYFRVWYDQTSRRLYDLAR